MAWAVAAGAGAAVLTAWLTLSPASHDRGLTVAEQQARQASFARLGAVIFPAVPDHEQDEALASMALPPAQQQVLAQDLTRAGTALVYVTLWDDQAQDGDVVTLSSQGLTRTVALTQAPQRLAMPIGAGAMTITGVHDGGGGITLAAQAASGPVLAPVLAQALAWLVPFHLAVRRPAALREWRVLRARARLSMPCPLPIRVGQDCRA